MSYWQASRHVAPAPGALCPISGERMLKPNLFGVSSTVQCAAALGWSNCAGAFLERGLLAQPERSWPGLSGGMRTGRLAIPSLLIRPDGRLTPLRMHPDARKARLETQQFVFRRSLRQFR